MEFSAPPDEAGASAHCTLRVSGDGRVAWVTHRRAGESLAEHLVTYAECDGKHLVRAIVETCRDGMRLPHPGLLTVRHDGPTRRLVDPLGLVRTGSTTVGVDCDTGPSSVDLAVDVTGPEEVRDLLTGIVERVTGRPTVRDDDEVILFDHDGRRIHLAVTADPPGARLWARTVLAVRSPREAAMHIAKLNLDEEWTQWVLDGHRILQRSTFDVAPFLPRHVQFRVEHFLHTFACTRREIASRLG